MGAHFFSANRQDGCAFDSEICTRLLSSFLHLTGLNHASMLNCLNPEMFCVAGHGMAELAIGWFTFLGTEKKTPEKSVIQVTLFAASINWSYFKGPPNRPIQMMSFSH